MHERLQLLEWNTISFERQQILYRNYPYYLLSKMKAHRKLVFNFVIAMSLITLLLLAEGRANESKPVHISNFEHESTGLQLGWKSRRLLQGERERPAPRGFPPPDGNALVHNPRRTPPSKTPWIPDKPPPLKIPPPHP